MSPATPATGGSPSASSLKVPGSQSGSFSKAEPSPASTYGDSVAGDDVPQTPGVEDDGT